MWYYELSQNNIQKQVKLTIIARFLKMKALGVHQKKKDTIRDTTRKDKFCYQQKNKLCK
jgi:hypothetical protein